MHTVAECFPCFERQVARLVALAEADPALQAALLTQLRARLAQHAATASPPEIMGGFYRVFTEMTGIADPYAAIKQHSTREALGHYPGLQRLVERADDRLRAAIKVAAVGNVIDFALRDTIDLDGELQRFASLPMVMDCYHRFRQELQLAGALLYIGDNAGETVFDRVLIEELATAHKGLDITFAVRSQPALNDALLPDAAAAGLNAICRVIESGAACPGTVPTEHSPEFAGRYRSADIVISKGQGNFETVRGRPARPVYYILKVKCPRVAAMTGQPAGTLLFSHEPRGGGEV